MKSFYPSAIFDYLGGQLGDKKGENLRNVEVKNQKICKYGLYS